jgi:uncharacterized protein
MKIVIYMRLKHYLFTFLFIVLTGSNVENLERDNMQNLYRYSILEAGEIKPTGWIKAQLHRDLTKGYIGHFDKVHHTVTHDVFINQNRRSNKRYSIIKEWWSGEHEGYWKDAVVRMAFLTDEVQYKKRAEQWMDALLNHIGEDGYIGIYENCEKPNCRFNHTRGNGELWATSRIIMAMLAYYEYTSDTKVLKAAENAVGLVMKEYENRNYFSAKSRGGGVSHGIGLFENLEWLYRITGEQKYLDFSVKLYDDFNNGIVRDDDLKTKNLLEENRYFQKHGAHIAEGLFVPAFIASQVADNLVYDEAAQNTLEKLYYHLTPGGAMRADEWIKGRKGTADERYEYCGIAEMISPLNKIISFKGDLSIADKIETMTFNAGQGARLPTLKALSYLTSDNRIDINHSEIGKRESYDAAHRAAACCVLNGGRLMPYFVEGMWMKNKARNELVAMLYGPNEVTTTMDNGVVTLTEKTNYPFEDNVIFTVKTEGETPFNLVLRKPFGTEAMTLNTPDGSQVEEFADRFVISKKWKTGDQITVDFNFKIKYMPQPESNTVADSGIYLKRGALVYALAFTHDMKTVKEYNESGFYRYRVRALNKENWDVKYRDKSRFTYKSLVNEQANNPWDEPQTILNGTMIDNKGNPQEVKLIPMGNTIFRRVTFPVYKP